MNTQSLYRLMSWLSPAYPVGSYAHSSGLEWIVAEGLVPSGAVLQDWISDVLAQGSGRNDAVLFAHAWRAAADDDQSALLAIAEIAAALHPSRERRFEATAQGAAFRRIASCSARCAALDLLCGVEDADLPYVIAVATVAAGHGVPLSSALTAYLHAIVANLVSAAQRLIPLGQTDAQLAMAALEPAVLELASWACSLSGEDVFADLGGATLMADFATLAHETQYTRLFRT